LYPARFHPSRQLKCGLIIHSHRDWPALADTAHRPRSRTRSNRHAWASAARHRPDTPRRTGKHRSACAHVLPYRSADRLLCCRAVGLVLRRPFPESLACEAHSHHRPHQLFLA
jgi:hypothetical protein